MIQTPGFFFGHVKLLRFGLDHIVDAGFLRTEKNKMFSINGFLSFDASPTEDTG